MPLTTRQRQPIPEWVVDLHSEQLRKSGQPVSGDAFLSTRIKEEDRVVAALADGLGSGVKANVLSTLTASMAVTFCREHMRSRATAEVILNTLPVCSERGIGYSTFTLVNLDARGRADIVEYDNPPLLLLRDGACLPLPRTPVRFSAAGDGADRRLHVAHAQLQAGDRLLLMSDGVPQSGMGTDAAPIGWGHEQVARFVEETVAAAPEVAANALAREVVQRAAAMDGGRPRDDITCAVLHVRRPRRLLVVTGPPFDEEHDQAIAERVRQFEGRTVICGGTTAGILARELGRVLRTPMRDLDPDVPPASAMDGIELVTEGTITLSRAAEQLERGERQPGGRRNAARRLVDLLLDSDMIEFVVGTRVNAAHQDPAVPVELDLRRNIVRRIQRCLEDRHLKRTTLEFA